MKYILQAGGGLVLIGVIAQLAIAVFSAWRRHLKKQEQYDLGRMILDERLAMARQLRQAHEESRHAWNGVRKFTVSKKTQEGGDICSFYLTPHDRKPIPHFKPGQYLTFELSVPGHVKKVIRCYSLSEAPGKEYYRVSIKRVTAPKEVPDAKPGISSNYFHDSINEGDILDVKSPSGSFYLDESKLNPVVLIGGGVGITPVLSMLNHVIATGGRIETWFFLGVTNGKEHVFKKHLEDVSRNHQRVHLNVCYSRPQSQDVKGTDYHHGERVTVDLLKRILPSNNFDYYICGPGPMMNTLIKDLKDWGVPDKNIHFEAFGETSVKKATASSPTADAKGITSQVHFSRAGKDTAWNASLGSLLELAEASGVALPFGCRAGNCGTCVTAIKEGEIEYIKEPGCDVETGSCLTCICKPKGVKLVLDA